MKVIKGQKRWEVMRDAENLEVRVASRLYLKDSPWKETSHPDWDWKTADYAIIDDSQPDVNWEKFNWDFFNLYGGVPYSYGFTFGHATSPHLLDDTHELRESPFYYWTGGKCPVPSNVVVSVISSNGRILTNAAKFFHWEHQHADANIVNFMITGDVI